MKKSSEKRQRALLAAILSLSLIALLAGKPVQGSVALNSLLGNGAVVQRGLPIAIFGTAADGEKITVRLGKWTAATTAHAGTWLVRLNPLPAGGPYMLTAAGPHNTVTSRDVLVGEVYVCSGQSNMQFNLAGADTGAQAIAQANDPLLHFYQVPVRPAATPQADAGAEWRSSTPQTASAFSAVAYFFGRDLRRTLHVPIGLIQASLGSTPAQVWASASALEALPDFRPAVETLLQQIKDPSVFQDKLEAWYRRRDPGSQGSTWASPSLNASHWKVMDQPAAFSKSNNSDFSAPFLGVAWFRKDVDVPASFAGRDLTLLLGPIDDEDTVYFNGVKVGGLSGWQQNRDYTVPAALVKPGRNVIAVRLLNRDGDGGIYGKPEQLSLQVTGAAPPVPLAGLWQYKIGTPLPAEDPVPYMSGLNPSTTPTVLYNGMIAPLTRYGIRGVIWYQGESSTYDPAQYRTLFPALIADWRAQWGEKDFPFFFVQLAPFMSVASQPQESSWAALREDQRLTAATVPASAMAVITDLGDSQAIHPLRKEQVGVRLAREAEALVYHQPVEYTGPLFSGLAVDGPRMTLRFTHAVGLHTQAVHDGNGTQVAAADKVTGFTLAGADGKYMPAEARIVGNTVVVTSLQVPQPLAVRYGWADYPVVNLYNDAHLPASPFESGSSQQPRKSTENGS